MPLLLNTALEYATEKVQENQERLALSRTYQPLVYTDDVNLVGENISAVMKNTKALFVTSIYTKKCEQK